MKLYITTGSPYARLARIVRIEKGLEGRVEIVLAQTRIANSPYYSINPSGRVPYLVRDDGVGMEESEVICRYLDHLDGRGRELVRPEEEQSPTIIRHEAERARRLTDLWETEIDHPVMLGGLNMVQIRLGCALGLEVRNPQLHWRPQHPKLSAWYDRIAERPSFGATAPPR